MTVGGLSLFIVCLVGTYCDTRVVVRICISKRRSSRVTTVLWYSATTSTNADANGLANSANPISHQSYECTFAFSFCQNTNVDLRTYVKAVSIILRTLPASCIPGCIELLNSCSVYKCVVDNTKINSRYKYDRILHQ